MQVKVAKTTLASPSAPPFHQDHVLSLSHLDTDPNLRLTFRYLRAYLNNPTTHPNPPCSNDPSHVISTALSAALVHYYPLAATLRRRPSDHRLELFCSAGQAVPLVHATVDCTLDSVNYLEDPDADFVEQLVPDPSPEEGLVKVNPCVLQVTVFRCGGFTLGAAMHHSLCDGLGGGQFFNAMAELARGAARPSVEPVWERARLLGSREPPRVEVPIQEFLSLDKESAPYSQASLCRIVREWFHVRDDCLERIKKMMFERSGLRFTTFEALGAFIWRAKVIASGIPGDENVKFAYSINIRKQVKPPLPVGYWGNGCVAMYVKLSAKEVAEKPIWETADLIRKSKNDATDEYVRSFIDFQELHYGDGITAGKRVSGFTDWRHLGHSTVDFGWGGPVTVLPLSRNLLGSVEPCFFLPYSSVSAERKDGFKVLVTLEQSALPAFRQEMDMFSGPEFGSSL